MLPRRLAGPVQEVGPPVGGRTGPGRVAVARGALPRGADQPRHLRPADRSGRTVRRDPGAFGTEYATSWRDLLDGLGQIWQARRLSGMEAELQPEHLAEMSSTWWWHTTVAEVATAVDHRVLSPLVLASAQDDDPRALPRPPTPCG